MMDVPKDFCVVIPTYNNSGTVLDIIRRTLAYVRTVIVIDDGSTDGTSELIGKSELPVRLVTFPLNEGKGTALKKGLGLARDLGFRYAVTLDSDGQHFPEDIPVLIEAVSSNPGALAVGSRNLSADGMPSGSTFANRFSNFWFKVQTGHRIPDTQSGFRAYPLDRLPSMRFLTARYEAELALLVLSAWKGIKIVSSKIRVYYPPYDERVSSFRPGLDFTRISILNVVLCLLAVVYGYPRMFIDSLTKWKS